MRGDQKPRSIGVRVRRVNWSTAQELGQVRVVLDLDTATYDDLDVLHRHFRGNKLVDGSQTGWSEEGLSITLQLTPLATKEEQDKSEFLTIERQLKLQRLIGTLFDREFEVKAEYRQDSGSTRIDATFSLHNGTELGAGDLLALKALDRIEEVRILPGQVRFRAWVGRFSAVSVRLVLREAVHALFGNVVKVEMIVQPPVPDDDWQKYKPHKA